MGSFDSLSSAVSGLQAQSFALQNISGNIANSQTTAYKTTDTSFQDLLNSQFAGMDASDGVQPLSTTSTLTQGTIQASQVGTYMAINGDGFFSVEAPSSTSSSGQPDFTGSTQAYTRRGDFQLDANGYLVNGAGDYLMGTPAASASGSAGATGTADTTQQLLRFDSGSLPTDQGTLQGLSVGTNGDIQGTFSSGKTVDLAGVPLSSFRGEEFLQNGDGGTFMATTQSGAAQAGASGSIVGSSLEGSNTDITDQFSTMIMTQQAYSANTKVVTASNEMLQTLTNMTL
jgi:flagellar hook protein FlgE